MNRAIWFILLATRLRDRLRCPMCKAVGTYKLHAPCNGTRGDPVPWRWLCKFCGFYRNKARNGFLCYPSKMEGCWAFFAQNVPDDSRLTPKQLIEQQMPWCWPWRG